MKCPFRLLGPKQLDIPAAAILFVIRQMNLCAMPDSLLIEGSPKTFFSR
jgi:hypothetical protein